MTRSARASRSTSTASGSATAERLNCDAACAGKQVQKPGLRDAAAEFAETGLLHTIHHRARAFAGHHFSRRPLAEPAITRMAIRRRTSRFDCLAIARRFESAVVTSRGAGARMKRRPPQSCNAVRARFSTVAGVPRAVARARRGRNRPRRSVVSGRRPDLAHLAGPPSDRRQPQLPG